MSKHKPQYQCERCSAPIQWQTTIYGSEVPLNLDGSSHLLTCPHAAEFTRKKRRRSKDQLMLFETAKGE